MIDVEVVTHDKGCVVRLLGCRLEGSAMVEGVNDKFRAGMENKVKWVDVGRG